MIMPINNNNNLMNMQQLSPYQDRYVNMSLGQQQTNNTNMNFLVVENIQKAKEQIVPYGYTMWMRDSNEPYQYIKSVDNVGTPTFKVLKVQDVTEIVDKPQQNNQSNYVPLDLFNSLSLKVEQLDASLNQYREELNKPKVGRPTKEKVGDNNE